MLRVSFVVKDRGVLTVKAAEDESLMRVAVGAGIAGIDGECGGSLSCATCHVYVDEEWIDRVGPPGENEEVMLEFAEGVQPNSRLSCQVKLSPALDGLVVRVPD